ncbi:MAG: DUF4012 domain-containing protein [Acidimicrobiales bacterium]
MGGGVRRRWAIRFGLLLALAWLAGTGWLLVSVRSAARQGDAELRRVRRHATISKLLDPAAERDLTRAAADFDRARSRLDNPLLVPLRAVPVVSRHLGAARGATRGAHQAAVVARDALGPLRTLVERDHATGPQRLALLRDLGRVARRVDTALGRIDLPDPRRLAHPVGDPVAELRDQRTKGRQAVRRLARVSDAVAAMLDGPSPYLLVGANNAEMRAGSGMFLSAATLGLDHGRLHLGDVRPTAELVLPKGSVAVHGDLAANWPWLDPGRDLRNVSLTADFPQVGPVAAANWARQASGAKVGGVLVVDVDGVRALLRAVGPVRADGIRYTSANIRGELLRNQYRRFASDRAVRRDQLGAVARAVFDRLEAGQWKVGPLADALVDAVQGRHVLVWSSDAATQRAWREVGADGSLDRRSLSVALLNRGAEKLDSYLDTRATVVHRRQRDGRIRLTLRYRVTNRSPASGPAYLVGPNVAGLSVGDHRGLVVANVPGGSDDVTITGGRQFLDGRDGPTRAVGAEILVRRGRRVTVTVSALLPAGFDDAVLEPAARISPTSWVLDGETFSRDRRRTVSLVGGDPP